MSGRVLNGRYRVARRIGEGGFGAVYEGVQLQMDRRVALKILHPHMTREPKLVARFRREAKAACNLRDAHTIITYDFDQTEDGILYLAMELLEGRSLLAELMRGGPLAPARAVFLVDQICSSLAEAHARGVVHRDIKPENIFLEDRASQRDYVKVLDFGIAKIMTGDSGDSPSLSGLTAAGQTLGTLEYMSPEQLAGSTLDGRSDLYSLGVMLYQMLVGRLPFSGPPTALISAHLTQTPQRPSLVRPGVPVKLDRVVMRCLEKEPAQRFPDVAALRAELAALGAGVLGGPLATSPAGVVGARAPSAPQVSASAATAAPSGVPLAAPLVSAGVTQPPTVVPAAVAPAAPAAVAPAVIAPAAVAPAAVAPLASATRPRPSSRSPIGLIIGSVLVGVLLLGGIGATLWYYFATREAGDGAGSGLAGAGSGLAGAGSGLVPAAAADARASLWRTPKAPERPPASASKGFAALVPSSADAMVSLSLRRLFEVPGFRAGWGSSLTPDLQGFLTATGTAADRVDEVVIVIPRLTARGADGSVDFAAAVRGVDAAAVCRFFDEKTGGASSLQHQGTELRVASDGALGVISKESVIGGKLAAVKAALDAQAAGGGLKGDDAELLAAVGGQPVAAGYLRFPAEQQRQLEAQLQLTDGAPRALAAGLSRSAGGWTLRAAMLAGSPGSALELKTKLGGAFATLRGNPQVAQAGLGAVLDAVQSAQVGSRVELTISLDDAKVTQLVTGWQRLLQSRSSGMPALSPGSLPPGITPLKPRLPRPHRTPYGYPRRRY